MTGHIVLLRSDLCILLRSTEDATGYSGLMSNPRARVQKGEKPWKFSSVNIGRGRTLAHLSEIPGKPTYCIMFPQLPSLHFWTPRYDRKAGPAGRGDQTH